MQHEHIDEIHSLQNSIDSWKSLTPEQVEMRRLGGLSNEMWHVISLDQSVYPQAVIFRKFGCSNMVDRKKENYILRRLSDKGVGPKIFGGSDEFRIERYYESTTLTPSKVFEKATRRELAKSVADLHKVTFEELDKTPTFLRLLDQKTQIKQAQEKVKREVYSDEETRMLEEIMTLTSSEETQFLRKYLPKKAESVVFSHNDLHSENILVLNKNQRLMLIDYEYSDYNYRGYDIANLFNESMFDYHLGEHPYYIMDESKFPTDDDLREFINYYLLFFKFRVQPNEADALLKDSSKITSFVQKRYNLDAFLEEVDEIFEEVKICRLLSHYFWILWAVMMSHNGDNFTFDYIHYAYKRYELYHKLKKQLFRRKLAITKTKSQGV